MQDHQGQDRVRPCSHFLLSPWIHPKLGPCHINSHLKKPIEIEMAWLPCCFSRIPLFRRFPGGTKKTVSGHWYFVEVSEICGVYTPISHGVKHLRKICFSLSAEAIRVLNHY
jgi:hypothetical protein